MLLGGQIRWGLSIVIGFNSVKVLHNHDKNSFVTEMGLSENGKKQMGEKCRQMFEEALQ